MSERRVQVIVVADSDLAFLPLGESSVVATAVERARSAACAPEVVVWVAEHCLSAWEAMKPAHRPRCDVSFIPSLAQLARHADADVVLLHEAQRPLTLPATFDRVTEAITGDVQRARPAHVVVDTLKVVDETLLITATVNRDEVQSLTSPEGYLVSAVSEATPPVGWFIAVEDLDATEFVRGDQESLKVREASDVLLVESFLAWQTS
jgi:2-C-methyl-D-erythritol 4-phosphate cytidylyltransferase